MTRRSFELPLAPDARKGLRGRLERWHARRVAASIADSPVRTFQVGGFDGALRKNYLLVDADKYQFIHWVLFAAGYECTTAKVMERCGADPDAKSPPEGVLSASGEGRAEDEDPWKAKYRWMRGWPVTWLRR
jgi:hypothetical protein